jgi:hypothetical protein
VLRKLAAFLGTRQKMGYRAAQTLFARRGPRGILNESNEAY